MLCPIRATDDKQSERPQSSADVTVLICVPLRVKERLQELPGQVVHGVRFLLHDPEADGAPPACDLVVHKGVNDLVLHNEDAAAAARYSRLQQLAAHVPLLDPLESMPVFADRGQLCRHVQQCPGGLRTVRAGYAHQPPACRTCRRRGAACLRGATHCTCAVHVPASAVLRVPHACCGTAGGELCKVLAAARPGVRQPRYLEVRRGHL